MKIFQKTNFLLGLLLLLGFLGNYFSLPLFFGADFLFGSVFTLLILYIFGVRIGLVAAIVVNSYTCFLWGHPYGFIIFTLEILFVGCFYKERQKNILLLDGLYWLLLGVPLNGIIYYVILHLGTTTTLFIILKQGINGIFNALLVNLAISYIPYNRFPTLINNRKKINIQETTFNLLVAMVLIPSLILTIIQIRSEMNQIEKSAVADLQMLSNDIQSHLISWHSQHLAPLQELALYSEKTANYLHEKLQHDTEVLNTAFPDFHAIHVENASGITVACSPSNNDRGSTIGINMSDREWYKQVSATLRPYISGAFIGSRLTIAPTVILSVPIIKGTHFGGMATGSINLLQIRRILELYSKDKNVLITLTDSGNRVIASTVPNRTPLQEWDRKTNGVVASINTSAYLWSPDEKNLPSMARWNKSYYVQEISIAPQIPWTLIIESPIAPFQKRLYALYVRDLAILTVLIILTLLLSVKMSRWLANPLENLATFTSSLPEKITTQKAIEWPESETYEVDILIHNFKSMTQALERSFQNINDHANSLDMTLNATADGILAVNANNKIIFYNKQFSKLWHIPQSLLDSGEDNILLDHVLEQLSEPDSFIEVVKRLYNSDEDSFDYINFKDGRIYERYSCPLQYGGSLSNGRVWSFRNITERRQTEANLQKKSEEVEQFLYSVSHDLRSPLVTVKTFMGYLEKDMSEGNHEHLSKDIGYINGAADKMKLLLDELLELSRIDHVESTPVRISLIEMMNEVVNILAGDIKDRNIDISLPDKDMILLAERQRIIQIWQNLIENAIKYSRDDNILCIELGVQNLNNETVFYVKDNGKGIDSEYHTKIFGIFEKLDSKSPGAGLGLSMVHRIVGKYGGRIWVESEGVGKGSCFCFTLPRGIVTG